MTAIRAFIAIELPAPIQHKLGEIIDQLKPNTGNSIHWVPASNIHLTLKFLGDVSSANIEILTRILSNISTRHRAFTFSISGLGAFPNIHRPRVVWVGVQAPPALLALQRSVESETTRLGYIAEDRSFSPHLTLGRVTHNATPPQVKLLADALGAAQVGELGVCSVEQVKLFRSDLKPGGAIYTPLFTSALKV